MNEPKNILIITGAAPCVIDDLTALANGDTMPHHVPVSPMADFMVIGLDAVDKYPWRIKYVATYHPDEIPQIRKRRELAGGNTDYLMISQAPGPGVDIVEPYRSPSGSSSLLGVLAALRMGYRRIILCGCPLIGKNDKGGKYETFQAGWQAVSKELSGRVRSMSGWTAGFLGMPTEEWLNA